MQAWESRLQWEYSRLEPETPRKGSPVMTQLSSPAGCDERIGTFQQARQIFKRGWFLAGFERHFSLHCAPTLKECKVMWPNRGNEPCTAAVLSEELQLLKLQRRERTE